MSVTTLAEAKLHLRVTDSAEDTLIQVWINAAEKSASKLIRRNLYADSGALAAAIAAAGAALSAASADYESAIDAADSMASDVEAGIARTVADESYDAAQSAARMTHAGLVVDDMVKAAVLLTVGHLYANREDSAQGLTELPLGAQHLLQPYKRYG